MAIGVTGTVELNGETIDTIYEDAVFAADAALVMAKVANVEIFNDRSDDSTRRGGEYPKLEAEEVGEYDVYENPQQFSVTNFASRTPIETITQAFLTDKRRRREGEKVYSNVSRELGLALARKVESKLLEGLADFTGGSLGSAGNPMKWSYLFAAKSILKAAGYDGQLDAVLHEFHWFDLLAAAIPGGSVVMMEDKLHANIVGQFYVGSVAGINLYTSARIDTDASDDAVSGVFAPGALMLDNRVPPVMEAERKGKGRRWELTMHQEFAAGSWRTDAGVKITADATAPTGA